jgi:beta-lactamase superfamily II metal-dependent hydrolase
VDLLDVPHLGSDNNVTKDFFARVTAEDYLFSANGRFGNPDVKTVAALIVARSCQTYGMYFRQSRPG